MKGKSSLTDPVQHKMQVALICLCQAKIELAVVAQPQHVCLPDQPAEALGDRLLIFRTGGQPNQHILGHAVFRHFFPRLYDLAEISIGENVTVRQVHLLFDLFRILQGPHQ